MMFLFSTVIYFDEVPAGYDVYREDTIFQFKPAIDSPVERPTIRAFFSNQLWIVEGTFHHEIIEQVKKIIELNELISVLNVAS